MIDDSLDLFFKRVCTWSKKSFLDRVKESFAGDFTRISCTLLESESTQLSSVYTKFFAYFEYIGQQREKFVQYVILMHSIERCEETV